jgi:hypothetical protein
MDTANQPLAPREPDAIMQFTGVSLPAAWSSRRTLKDIRAYSALLKEYRRFLVAVRHFGVELAKLRDLPLYTDAERLAVQVRVAQQEQEIAAIQEEAEIARLERALKKAMLNQQLAEHSASTRSTADALVEINAIISAVKASCLAEDSPLLTAMQALLFESVVNKLSH